MKLIATRKSAVFAGTWCVLGAEAFQAWERSHPTGSSTQQFLPLIWAAIFFFIPAFLFVMGPQFIRSWWELAGTRPGAELWEVFRGIFTRSLFWILGGFLSVVVLLLVRLVFAI